MITGRTLTVFITVSSVITLTLEGLIFRMVIARGSWMLSRVIKNTLSFFCLAEIDGGADVRGFNILDEPVRAFNIEAYHFDTAADQFESGGDASELKRHIHVHL